MFKPILKEKDNNLCLPILLALEPLLLLMTSSRDHFQKLSKLILILLSDFFFSVSYGVYQEFYTVVKKKQVLEVQA